MVCLAILTAVYLFFGGYFATALSDFIQGIIMLIGVVLMVICFMNSDKVNWDLSTLTANPNLNWFTFESTNTGLYGNTVSLISLILLTSMGVWALPQTIHKYYAVRDKKSINQGMIVSTLFALIIGFGAYFTGALSGLFPEFSTTAGDKIIPYMLAKVIPVGLTGVIAVLILSASMSTLSSVSLASASVVAVDIYKGAIKKDATDKQVNWTMRILCLAFILVSVVLAVLNEKFQITAIAYMMGISWGTLAGCFIGPFVLGVISKKVTKTACWTSVISSLVLTVGLIFFFGYHKNGFDCGFGLALKTGVGCSPMIGVICMIASLVLTVVVSAFTQKPSEEILYNAFDKEIANEIK
jgi:Na+/proline symporter